MNLKKITKIFVGLVLIKFTSIYAYINVKSKKQNKLNIVFDLDETLIFTEKIKKYSEYNVSNLSNPDYLNLMNRHIWIRPFVYPIIPILYKFNNIYIFTKATQPYTDTILEKTKLEKYIKGKKYRDDCKNNCKDITKLMLDLDSSILIDDKLSNQCLEHNFYHIPRFNHYVKFDYEFIKLFYSILWINIKNDYNNWKKNNL